MVFEEVLIVDDSFTSRMIIQRCIEMAGFEVGGFRYAENGLDAIAEIKEHPGISVIVTDINMPGISGLELLSLVKALKPDLPVFMISAYGDGETMAQAAARGASKFLTKPVDFPALKREFSALVSEARGPV